MSGWARKRFWKSADVAEAEGGFAVELDGRMLRTPARAALVVPTRALAERIAAEWNMQQGTVRPETMPATRAANAALDKVRGQFDEVAQIVAAYGETDLLCYRAAAPAGLRAAQDAAWDPLLAWARERFGIELQVVTGVMPHPQPPAAIEALEVHVARFSPFELTALHDLVAMSGSLVIGLAATEAVDTAENLWILSRIDEDWQIAQWGEDAEAAALAAVRRQSFLHAADFFAACRQG